jgi:hypothetical protein
MTRNHPVVRSGLLSFAVAGLMAAALAGAAPLSQGVPPASNTPPAVLTVEQQRALAQQRFAQSGKRFEEAIAARDDANELQCWADLQQQFNAAQKLGFADDSLLQSNKRYQSIHDSYMNARSQRDLADSYSRLAVSYGQDRQFQSLASLLPNLEKAFAGAAMALKPEAASAMQAKIGAIAGVVAKWREEQAAAQAAAQKEAASLAATMEAMASSQAQLPAADDAQVAEAAKMLVSSRGLVAEMKTIDRDRRADFERRASDFAAAVQSALNRLRCDAARAAEQGRVRDVSKSLEQAGADPAALDAVVAAADRLRTGIGEDAGLRAGDKQELFASVDDLVARAKSKAVQARDAAEADAVEATFEQARAAKDEASSALASGNLDSAGASIETAKKSVADAEAKIGGSRWNDANLGKRLSTTARAIRRELGGVEAALARSRADEQLGKAMSAADEHLHNWDFAAADKDVADVQAASAVASVSAQKRADAERCLQRFRSARARYDALAKYTKSIESALDDGDLVAARGGIENLLKASAAPALGNADREAINDLGRRYEERVKDLERARLLTTWLLVAAVLATAAAGFAAWKYLKRPRAAQNLGSERPSVAPSVTGGSESFRVRMAELGFKVRNGVRDLEEQRRQTDVAPATKAAAARKLAQQAAIEGSRIDPEVPGAAPLPPEWEQVVRLVKQLANMGLVSEARTLLEMPEVRKLLPDAPVSEKFTLASNEARLANGSRCAECAIAWVAIADAAPSRPAELDAKVQEWFALAVKWLPDLQDVPVLTARAAFERSRGKIEDASNSLKEARARFELAKSLDVRTKCDVLVLSAELEMDKAGAVAATARNLPEGECLSIAQEDAIRNYLRQAESALEGKPRYHAQGTYVAAGGASTAECAAQHFRIQRAYVRLCLGTGDLERAAGDILQALGEHAPESELAISIDRVNQKAQLLPGWSRLSAVEASLSVADRVSATELRMQLVRIYIALARPLNAGPVPKHLRVAAWLVCRYGLFLESVAGTDVAPDVGALKAYAIEIIKPAPPAAGWVAEDHNPSDRVIREYVRRVAELPEEPRDTPIGPGDGDVAPQPQEVSNVLISGKREQASLGAPAVLNELRVIDPSGSKTNVDGHIAWIELAGGKRAKALGVFGHSLDGDYFILLKKQRVMAGDAYEGGGTLFGTVDVLGTMDLAGLPDLEPGFQVRFGGPQRSAFGFSGGLGGALRPDSANPWSISVGVSLAARPAAALRPVSPPVSAEDIAKWMFESGLFLAGVTLGAGPVDGIPAVERLAEFLVEELGSARMHVADARSKAAAGLGGPGAEVLNRAFLRQLSSELQYRDPAVRLEESRAAWQRMERSAPAVRSALIRLVHKFAAKHAGALIPESLAPFGIVIGAPLPPPIGGGFVGGGPGLGGGGGVIGGGSGSTAPPPAVAPAADADFRRIAEDARDYAGGGPWHYASNRDTLRLICDQIVSALEEARLQSSDPTRRAGIDAALARARAFRATL